ncbi:serine/threonine-protein kinase [Cryptosporangium sp. NPDC051539]|uniref:serine/threonine-protein kinase n=1 Tax=Cryptosporangium sp. NPDC051539 TaxID=3363962 RepID=UPI0037964B2F
MRGLEPDDPRAVGRYRILARLGSGGMAIVYFGRSPGYRAVAVKRMHPRLAGNPEYRERFVREVEALRRVGGQYCPSVLGAEAEADVPWLATEFVPSVSLRDAVAGHGALPAASVRLLAAGLAEALASIHRAGLAHLDLKPANVLLAADGPRVIDFGIATALGGGPAVRAGSRGFMAPEQVAGGPVGPESDVFALGATLVAASAGSPPPDLRPLIADCLRPDPAARPSVRRLTDAFADATPSGPWLPDAVRREIEERAEEADSPPEPAGPADAAPAGVAGTRWGRRRVLGWAGLAAGAVALGGVPLGFSALRSGGEPRAGTVAASPSHSATPARTPSAGPGLRTVEFIAFGHTTVRSLTTAVNGRSLTVRAVTLPYRRTLQLEPWPGEGSWRIEFHCGPGMIQCVVLVDGLQVAGAGSSSTGDDINETYHGAL